jgi:signal transduction histidine kinase
MRFIFHEVSSPLNSIHLGLECLKNEPLEGEGLETLQTIVNSAEEIQDVLQMFRAQVLFESLDFTSLCNLLHIISSRNLSLRIFM